MIVPMGNNNLMLSINSIMFSLFKGRGTRVEEIKNLFPGVLPEIDGNVSLEKSKVSNEIEIFENLKESINQHILLLADMETLINSPVEKVESFLSSALLPDHKDLFTELLAYVKLTNCYHAKSGQDAYQHTLDVLMHVLHDDSKLDCFDLLYLMKKFDRWPPSVKKADPLVSISMQSTRIGDCVNSLKEGGDVVKHMQSVKDNKHVTDKLKAFFEVVRRVNATPV